MLANPSNCALQSHTGTDWAAGKGSQGGKHINKTLGAVHWCDGPAWV